MDEEVKRLIEAEEKRQRETLAVIPSENYASRAVQEAAGSVLMNKYSEGYPGRRYYQGNSIVDEVENLAVERAKKLFGVPHVNVQPYSGSPANAAVLMGLVEPGEKIMGLKLSGGGHLTHGHPRITFSGRYYQSVQFDVDDAGWIDYERVAALVRQEKPKLMLIGTTAYPRVLEWDKFGRMAEEIGAYLVADISHIAGLVVSGVHPDPVPFVHGVTTTTHKTLRGPRGAMIMVTGKGLVKDPEMGKKIDRAVFPGLQGGPHDNTTAAIAVALGEAQAPEFKSYGRQVVTNARVLAESLVELGLKLTTGGTDNHLMVVDLRPAGGGKEAAVQLEKAGIVANYNSVPHDTNPPMNPSGVRLGTPALTTRGMKEEEMKTVAGWVVRVVRGAGEKEVEQIRREVRELCRRFPVP